MNRADYCVCVLVHPRKQWESRFVGVTTDPKKWHRTLMRQAIDPDELGGRAVRTWIAALQTGGHQPRLEKLASGLTRAKAVKFANEVMDNYAQNNRPLLNGRRPGRGAHTEAAKARMRGPRGKGGRKVPVVDGLGRRYPSIKAACAAIGYKYPSNMVKHLDGIGYPTILGQIFYREEYDGFYSTIKGLKEK